MIPNYGLLGAALAPLSGYLLVSLWYFPRNLSRLGGLTSLDLRSLAVETIWGVLIGGILVFMFKVWMPSISHWSDFVMATLVFALSYIGFLFLFSHQFRLESRNILRRVL